MDRAGRSERGDGDVSTAGVQGFWRLLVVCRCDKEIKISKEEDVILVTYRISDGKTEMISVVSSLDSFCPFTMLFF
jgi:hypothetical protein